jgi:hypothetical protein
MSELVSIPVAVVEVTIDYVSPKLKLLMDRANVVTRLFELFAKWDITTDDMEVVKKGKNSEQGVRFKLPSKNTSFFFGANWCKLTLDSASWDFAEDAISILDAAWEVLAKAGEIERKGYRVSLAMHVQPKTKSFIELLKPFAPEPLTRSGGESITGVASLVRWQDHKITLDGSARLANAIFIRLEREFPSNMTLQEIAGRLRQDEDEAFELIGIREDV